MSGSTAVTRPPRLGQATRTQREQLLNMVADGMTLTTAAMAIGVQPAVVLRWIRTDEEFAAKWNHAVQAQAAMMQDQIIEIADAPMASSLDLDHAKLKIETRQWIMSKTHPAQYGTKVQTSHSHVHGVILLPALNPGDAKQISLKDVSKLVGPGNHVNVPRDTHGT